MLKYQELNTFEKENIDLIKHDKVFMSIAFKSIHSFLKQNEEIEDILLDGFPESDESA